MEEEFRSGGTGYGEFKKRLFGTIWEYFTPMRLRREELASDKAFVDRILEQGSARANCVAEVMMKKVRAATGLS